MLGSLYMVVEHLYHVCLWRNILRYFGVNHFILGLSLIEGLLHHTRAHGSHLGTMVGVDDSGHDVAAKGRSNLIEQVLVGLLVLLVLVGTDLQFGAVGGETAGERGRHARTQVTSDNGGTHEADLWFLFLEEVYENVSMWGRGIGEETLTVEDEEFVHTIGKNLFFHFTFDI